MSIKVSKAWKAVVTAVGGALTVLTGALGDDVLELSELGQLGTATAVLGLTVYGVWKVPNRDSDPLGDAEAKLIAALDHAAQFGRIAEEQARALRNAEPRKAK